MFRQAVRRGGPVALVLAAALAAAPASAQQQQQQPAQPQAAQAPIAPSHLAAARELIQVTGMMRGFDGVVPQLTQQLKGTFAISRPEIMDELTKTLDQLKPEFDKQRDDIINATARLYAQALSEQDIKDLVAFFKTPAGSHYITAQPKVLDGLFVEMQAWGRRLSEYMLVRVREEMKKKNIDM